MKKLARRAREAATRCGIVPAYSPRFGCSGSLRGHGGSVTVYRRGVKDVIVDRER